jgi:hypothetical protein
MARLVGRWRAFVRLRARERGLVAALGPRLDRARLGWAMARWVKALAHRRVEELRAVQEGGWVGGLMATVVGCSGVTSAENGEGED